MLQATRITLPSALGGAEQGCLWQNQTAFGVSRSSDVSRLQILHDLKLCLYSKDENGAHLPIIKNKSDTDILGVKVME